MEIPIEKLTQEQWEVFEALNAQKDDFLMKSNVSLLRAPVQLSMGDKT